MTRMHRIVWLTAGGILIALAGCGGPKLHPVSGAITYKDGTPMPGGGQITFTPIDPNIKTGARGMINEEGIYKMGTFGETDGVLEGAYRVAIVPTPPPNITRPPKGWPPLKKKYSNQEKSGLEYTVTRGRNTFDVTVEK